MRSGPYKGAVVNFRVNLPAAYPTEAPSIELLDRPFHPHVNPVTGILDCGELVRNWQPHKSFVYGTNSVCAFSAYKNSHVLLSHLKKVFYQIEVWRSRAFFPHSHQDYHSGEVLQHRGSAIVPEEPAGVHAASAQCCTSHAQRHTCASSGTSVASDGGGVIGRHT